MFNPKTLPLFVAATGLVLLATDVMAQPGGRGRGGRGGGQARGGIAALLMREDVQQELEMTEDQIEELRELASNRGGQRMDREKLREELEGLSDDERREKFQEMREQRTQQQKEQLGEVLLPQQVRRLEQLTVQFTARAAGGQAMFRGNIAEQLGLTEEQRDELQERAQELQKEYNKKMQELREQMQEDFLDELSAEQRKKYREMIGESFQFEETQNRGRGGRGARGGEGRGGEGGRRGGRGRPGRDRGEDF